MASCRESDGAAASAAGFRTSHAELLRRHASPPDVAQSRVHEGFRQVAVKPHHVERLNRRFGRVWVPKVGWVRFRLSRPVPDGVKSYRSPVIGWPLACRVRPHPRPDHRSRRLQRGRHRPRCAVSAALSTGELLHAPGLTPGESKRLKVLQQRFARAKRGSHRRERRNGRSPSSNPRQGSAQELGRENHHRPRAALRRDQGRGPRRAAMTRSARGTAEQPGTRVAQKRGLNRAIRRSGWGQLVTRLQHKAFGRVEQIPAAYTSQRCSACGHVAPGTARAKRSSNAKPALPGGVTPTSTLHATSPPDGR